MKQYNFNINGNAYSVTINSVEGNVADVTVVASYKVQLGGGHTISVQPAPAAPATAAAPAPKETAAPAAPQPVSVLALRQSFQHSQFSEALSRQVLGSCHSPSSFLATTTNRPSSV